jgi:osmoprotectant transport system substrate-binding protein
MRLFRAVYDTAHLYPVRNKFKEEEMTLLRRSLGAKFLVLFALIPMLILSACGSSTGSPTGSGTSTPSKVPVTVGSKLDPEAQLLGEMYVLLLQKAGYTVTPKLALGQTPTVFAALKSSAIDLYPEFTATGLNLLGVTSSFNPAKDYQAVKSGFEQQYHITWLDYAPLNDGYALCTSQAESQSLGVTTLSQLAPKVSQLTLATQSDGVTFFDDLKATYGFQTSSFKAVKKVDYSIGFAAVKSGAAQVTECYTTDGSVTTQNFIFLNDDKHGFPEFHPAPIVRDSILQSDPGIATALNPLAPKLTTQVSIQLQQKVSQMKASGTSTSEAVKQVAKQFLQSVGLY